MDNRYLSVSGIVMRDEQVLLVRQSYGRAQGLLIIPGGYLQEGEMPDRALEREILEETGICVKVGRLMAVRYSAHDWWSIFTARYVSGEPSGDGEENTEALFMNLDEALAREDLTGTTREILMLFRQRDGLACSSFCPSGVDPQKYRLYM